MLISRTHKINFINYKYKINLFEKVHKKLIFIILILFLTSFYYLSKTTNIFTESKLYFLNKILINNGFIIKNVEILGVNHLDKNDIIKIIRAYNNINIFNVNINNIYREIKTNTWIKKASAKYKQESFGDFSKLSDPIGFGFSDPPDKPSSVRVISMIGKN